jgi:octaprenyl-diphosphate synthase
VLTGDFLLARALSIAAETGLLSVITVISNITEQMSQGEIEQLHNKGKLDLSDDDYMEVIRRKTAVLIEGACQVGGMVARVSDEQVRLLKQYGHNLGMAFQMADDLLDYTAETSTLGKTVGADLKEGKLTLPVIIALKNAGANDRAEMLQTIQNKSFSENEFKIFQKLLETYGGILYTTQKAQGFVQSAKEALKHFSPSREKELLKDIADYALIRRV